MFSEVGLVKKFAVKSGLFALLIVAALSVATFVMIERMHVRMAARTAQLTANSVMAGEIGEAELKAPLTGRTLEHVEGLTGALRQEGVSAVRLWGADGRLLYSSKPSDPVGRVFSQDGGLSEALSGTLDVGVVREGGDGEAGTRFSEQGPLIEVYAPLRMAPDGPVGGAFEIYQPYSAVVADARQSTALLVLVIALTLLVGYVVQLRIIKDAASDLAFMDEEQTRLKDKVQSSLQDLEDHLVGTLQALTATVDAKDSYTASHALTVTRYATMVGAELGLSAQELADLERASLLHDIGKIGIPESVLNKSGAPTPDEYDVLKDHAEIGARIVETIPALTGISEIICHHHERWDGLGYPEGLMGEQISLQARILAVADAFDAMTTDRPYRKAMSLSQARHELAVGSGTQFDPACAEVLLRLVDEQGEDLLGPHEHRHGLWHGHWHLNRHGHTTEHAAA